MNAIRNLLFASTASFALVLSACQPNTEVTPAQVVADLSGVVQTLQRVEPLIVAADPKLISPAVQLALVNDLALAQQALAGFSQELPVAAGASVARQVEGYLNDVVNVLATIPNPYSTEINAAAVILPIVEIFVNKYLPVGASPALNLRASAKVKGAAPMPPDLARRTLHIAVVAK